MAWLGLLLLLVTGVRAQCPTDQPPVWPEQLVIVQRRIPDDGSGNATTVTYYDYTAGANLVIITNDNDEANPLYDLELTTGHSYTSVGREKKQVGGPAFFCRSSWWRAWPCML